MVCRLILSLSSKMVSTASEVDIGRGEIGDALMVSQVIVMSDEAADVGFEITRQIVVVEQDAVLEGLVPALDLALCLGMQRRART